MVLGRSGPLKWQEKRKIQINILYESLFCGKLRETPGGYWRCFLMKEKFMSLSSIFAAVGASLC